MMTLPTLDKIAMIPEMGAKDTHLAIAAAHEAFKLYKKTTTRQRVRWLRKWSDLCMENIDNLALILTLENGKTLSEAKAEVIYAAAFSSGLLRRLSGCTARWCRLRTRISAS
jgi:succinate-semialdehyde dehydrogenase / glutarate-semialdehyde dehydrogenase